MTRLPPSDADIARLLEAAGQGDPVASDDLFGIVYDRLCEVARSQRRRWGEAVSLNTTAVVHEAYLRLVGPAGIRAESRGHLLAIAAKAMRHVLSNHARDRRRLKRGGGAHHVPFEEGIQGSLVEFSSDEADQIAALDGALSRLESSSPRRAAIVECRFFAGLTIDQTAVALEISPATVKREWTLARAWLFREMERGPGDQRGP